jgi:formate dehydrogenase maturation protein FdhE
VDHRLAKGLPLIDLDDLYIDEAFSTSFFQSLLTLFRQYPTQFAAVAIASMRRALQKKQIDCKELIRNFAAKNADYFLNLAQRINVDPGLLSFMAKTMSLPFFEIYRELFHPQLEQADAIWFKPLCPLCGNTPSMARLEKEAGQRYLWCSTCNTQWIFPRMLCPFCLNKDQDQLRYFYDEMKKFYRVYVCDNCKRFIKTIDERENNHQAEISMTTEDMATHFLDDLAVDEGFQNAVRWIESDKYKNQFTT